eukprot:TRINITY_DN4213_c0_g1_i1.p1 TRINITY_DN4213_c0_g1~~TRINITY_DN4213_c0_g1_i1.p1  ORF type:complete len:281 (+),score=79.13 TRINITY_DN4213_c0_g1_i1:511-1353(+)
MCAEAVWAGPRELNPLPKDMAWVESLGPVLGPLIYIVCATAFISVSPTGYGPTVVAGVTFGYIVGPLMSIFFTNAGACVNILWVRALREKLLSYERVRRYFDAKAGKVPGLELLLTRYPLRTVLLMRLPFMANGVVNYLLSLSSVRWQSAALGTLIGMLPGCILFSVLGTQVTSFLTIIRTRGENKTGLIIFAVITVVTVLCIGALVLAARHVMKREQQRLQAQHEREEAAGTPTEAADDAHKDELEQQEYVPGVELNVLHVEEVGQPLSPHEEAEKQQQ